MMLSLNWTCTVNELILVVITSLFSLSNFNKIFTIYQGEFIEYCQINPQSVMIGLFQNYEKRA